jgi:hypothetical protein
MEGNKTSIKLDGDSSGLEAAAKRARTAINEITKTSKQSKKEIKEFSNAMGELSSSFDGIGGEIASMVSSLATAATGIGAIVIVVGALAKAWETSKENIDLYLKSADKLKAGSGGFLSDAQSALEDTKKRAKGLISLGYERQMEYGAKILGPQRFLYTEAEKEHFKILMAEGVQMQKNGRILLDSVRGIHDKEAWQEKYTKLLEEEETLNDAGLANATKWEAIEADFAKQKEIIANHSSTEKEKADAVVKATKDANQLGKEKSKFIDEQLVNINAIAEMTQTQEVVENKVADLQKQKNTLLKEYSLDMLKVDRLETKSLKTAKEKLQILKEINTTDSGGYNVKQSKKEKEHLLNIQHKGIGQVSLTSGSPGIQPYGGNTPDEIKAMIENMKEIPNVTGIIDTLSLSFNSLGSAINGAAASWVSYIGGVLSTIPQAIIAITALIVAKRAQAAAEKDAAVSGAAAAVAGIPIIGPILAVAAIASVLAAILSIPKFASGTNYAPGGLSLVGEHGPELVNLPRGSQVIPNNKLGGGDMLVAKLRGRDVDIILKRHYAEISSNT